jgi:uncharacterized protein (DUF983 family)
MTRPPVTNQYARAACDDCGGDIEIHSTADQSIEDHEEWYAMEDDAAKCVSCGAGYLVSVSGDGIAWLEHVQHGRNVR